MKKFLSLIFAALLGSALSFYIVSETGILVKERVVSDRVNDSDVQFTNLRTAIAAPPGDFTSAADKSLDAVVHVKTTIAGQTDQNIDPWMYFFFGPSYQNRPKAPQMGSGSGVIISDEGYIVTNNHVIDNADIIEVSLNDKKTYKAELVGKDPTSDLALLKIQSDKELPYLDFANSDQTMVGEWVLAVGNPFNLNSTVTAGIISAKGRDINILKFDPNSGLPPIESFIQTDAAVNPGNSGGALVNTSGELVGINTAIKSNTGSYAGYSFAIPANIVKKVVSDIKEFGAVQRGFIGVSIREIDEDLADQEGIEDLNGIYVSGLTDDGAAEEAGIKTGDIIVRVAERNVTDIPSLQEELSKYRPGDKVTVGVKRKGEEKDFIVELKNRFGEVKLVKAETRKVNQVLGADFGIPDKKKMKELGLNYGVEVQNLRAGKLSSAGVRDGFIITKIDSEPIYQAEDIYEILENKKGGVLVEGMYPNGTPGYFGFGMK